MRVRALFISDVHLGCGFSRSQELFAFLGRYEPDRHDEFLRAFSPHSFGTMELADQFIHETLDGERLLVIHGDVFDHLTKHAALKQGCAGVVNYNCGDWIEHSTALVDHVDGRMELVDAAGRGIDGIPLAARTVDSRAA
jgi:UDP-2,3-diacylglucosamine pyrophosphatase LpxH